MTLPPDRVWVWNVETREMSEPATILQLLLVARKSSDTYVWPDEYSHLVFMRNTGIYDQSLALHDKGGSIEIFDNDLITHGSEPYIYRVVQKRGCWWAVSLCPDIVPSRPLIAVWNPTIVGNMLEYKNIVETVECD